MKGRGGNYVCLVELRVIEFEKYWCARLGSTTVAGGNTMQRKGGEEHLQGQKEQQIIFL